LLHQQFAVTSVDPVKVNLRTVRFEVISLPISFAQLVTRAMGRANCCSTGENPRQLDRTGLRTGSNGMRTPRGTPLLSSRNKRSNCGVLGAREWACRRPRIRQGEFALVDLIKRRGSCNDKRRKGCGLSGSARC
jgi:hypothetical protein